MGQVPLSILCRGIKRYVESAFKMKMFHVDSVIVVVVIYLRMMMVRRLP